MDPKILIFWKESQRKTMDINIDPFDIEIIQETKEKDLVKQKGTYPCYNGSFLHAKKLLTKEQFFGKEMEKCCYKRWR